MIFPEHVLVLPDTEESLLYTLCSEFHLDDGRGTLSWVNNGIDCRASISITTGKAYFYDITYDKYTYYPHSRSLHFDPIVLPDNKVIKAVSMPKYHITSASEGNALQCMLNQPHAQRSFIASGHIVTIDLFNKISKLTLVEIFSKLVVYESQLNQLNQLEK